MGKRQDAEPLSSSQISSRVSTTRASRWSQPGQRSTTPGPPKNARCSANGAAVWQPAQVTTTVVTSTPKSCSKGPAAALPSSERSSAFWLMSRPCGSEAFCADGLVGVAEGEQPSDRVLDEAGGSAHVGTWPDAVGPAERRRGGEVGLGDASGWAVWTDGCLAGVDDIHGEAVVGGAT